MFISVASASSMRRELGYNVCIDATADVIFAMGRASWRWAGMKLPTFSCTNRWVRPCANLETLYGDSPSRERVGQSTRLF